MIQLVVGLSPRRSGIDFRSMNANLELGAVALGWICLPVILFASVSVTLPGVSIYFHAAVFRRTATFWKSEGLEEFVQRWLIGILFVS